MCNNDNDNMLVKLQMTPKPRPNHEDQDRCPVNNKTIIKKTPYNARDRRGS
jgi:hypothetical protein